MCTRQRNKNKSMEVKVPDLQKWHSKFCEHCIQLDKTFNSKWGRFKPHQHLNVDQSPLSSVTDPEITYEYDELGAKDLNIWISQPGSGQDKGTLQVMFHPDGKLPRLAGVEIALGHESCLITFVK